MADIHGRITAALARAAELPVRDPERTALLGGVARDLLELRRSYRQPDGRIDWSGSSTEYKADVRALYEAAGLAPDQIKSMSSAVRTRMRSIRGDVIPLADMKALGLDPDPVATRRADRARSALRSAAREVSIGAFPDVVLGLSTAAEILESLDPVDVRQVAGDDPETVGPLLDRVQAALSRLPRDGQRAV